MFFRAAYGVDAADVPVGPGQHQLGNRPPAAAVCGHEPPPEESAGCAGAAQPVCRRHDRARGHDTVGTGVLSTARGRLRPAGVDWVVQECALVSFFGFIPVAGGHRYKL